ncbi:MAG: radical SAM protein [Planctomycetes bacterium]|nr:radical SAM protein [Planctomycetota bacterium]
MADATYRVVESRSAADGTERLLLEGADATRIETVAMPASGHTTVCVSTQAGCPVGCRFCASGLAGFGRNLTAAEISGQVAAVAALPHLPPPRRVVFMGVGEPLLNARAVGAAVTRIERDFGIGRKRMRVSTVGILAGLAHLAALPRPPGLALSLHAARDDLRRRLIPYRPLAPIADAVRAALDYGRRARVRIAIQYLLLAGVNDGDDDARGIRDLFARERVKIDLLRHNEVAESPFRAASREREDAFAALLYRAGLHVSRRTSRGAGAGAACGQLRRQIPNGGAAYRAGDALDSDCFHPATR